VLVDVAAVRRALRTVALRRGELPRTASGRLAACGHRRTFPSASPARAGLLAPGILSPRTYRKDGANRGTAPGVAGIVESALGIPTFYSRLQQRRQPGCGHPARRDLGLYRRPDSRMMG